VGTKIATEFSSSPAKAVLRDKWWFQATSAMGFLRETVGRALDGTEKKPNGWLQSRLGLSFETIEELRADLAALYLIFDSDIEKTGLVPDEKCAETAYDIYVSSMFEGLAFMGSIPNSWITARMIAVGILMEAGAVTLESKEGERLTWQIVDYAKARETIKSLLAQVRRIRFVGDGKAARDLIEKHDGIWAKPWRDELIKRWSRAKLPRSVAFSYPLLGLRGGTAGADPQHIILVQREIVARQLSIAAERALLD